MGAGHEHGVPEHEVGQLVVDHGSAVVAAYGDGPSDLACERKAAVLEHEHCPLQEVLQVAGAGVHVCGGSDEQRIGGPHPVDDLIEAVVLVVAPAVPADLACEADVAVRQAVVVDVDDLHLDPVALEHVLYLVQDVAGVPHGLGASVDGKDFHALRIPHARL